MTGWISEYNIYVVTGLSSEYLCCKVKFIEDGILYAVEFEDLKGEGGALLTSPNECAGFLRSKALHGSS